MRRAVPFLFPRLVLFPWLAFLLAVTPSTTLRSAPRKAAAQTHVPPLTITTPSLPSGVVNTEYTAIVLASGGLAPYSFGVAAGSLPPGVILDGGTGTLRGTPTMTGTSAFTIQITDSENPPVQASQNLEITVVGG
jgi:Putative Ig domain